MAICWEKSCLLGFPLLPFLFCAVLVVCVPFPLGVWGRMCKFFSFFFFFIRLYRFVIFGFSSSLYEPPHDKTNKMSMRPAKTQISVGIRPVSSESSLSAWRKLGSLATHWAHSEDSDQPRLIWVFAGRTLILLSCRGSYKIVGSGRYHRTLTIMSDSYVRKLPFLAISCQFRLVQRV